MHRLLAVVTGDVDAPSVLSKTGRLAVAGDGRVDVVSVAYEPLAEISLPGLDSRERVRALAEQSAADRLTRIVARSGAGVPVDQHLTVWNKRRWQGVLAAATSTGAELIVTAIARHDRIGDVLRTPDDWQLCRHARVPVLLVGDEPWPERPVVLAAVDAFDDAHDPLNQTLLNQAAAITRAIGGQLHLVTVYPMLESWIGELAIPDTYLAVKRDIESRIVGRVNDLADRLGLDYQILHTEEGGAVHGIDLVARTIGARVLVIGTAGRGGLTGYTLGNTSEQVLQQTDLDVLVVPGQNA